MKHTDAPLVCAFGEPLEGEHPLCEAELKRIVAEHEAEIAAGKYDSESFTPKERRKQQKKGEAR